MKKQTILILISAALFFVAVVVVYVLNTARANSTLFYPSQCLGTWENPNLAQGAPDALEGSAMQNELNSAVYNGGMKELYCGNFSGNLPIREEDMSGAEISSAKIRIYWDITKEKKELPEVAKEVSDEETIELNATTTQEGVPSESPVVTQEPSPTTGDPSPEPTPEETQQIPQEQSSPSAEEMPLTFLFRRAHAQEISPEEVPPSPESLPEISPNASSEPSLEPSLEISPETLPQISPEISVEPSMETSPEPIVETSPLPEPTAISSEEIFKTEYAEPALFELMYTLDGVEWKTLGGVTQYVWRNAEFEIPVQTWEEIANLQIRVVNASFFEGPLYAYLDGVGLEISYRFEEPSLEPTPDYTPMPSPTPERPIFNERSKHSCEVEPFINKVKIQAKASAQVLLTPYNQQGAIRLEVGGLPPGVFVSAERASGKEARLSVAVDAASPKGSFSAMVIYDEQQADNEWLANFCQFNLIIEE